MNTNPPHQPRLPISTVVKSREECYVEFTSEQADALHIKAGDKFSCSFLPPAEGESSPSLQLTRYASLEIDLEDFSKSVLIHLITQSFALNLPVEDVIESILSKAVGYKS